MSIFIPLNMKFFIINYKGSLNCIIIYTYDRYISLQSQSIHYYKLSNTIVINGNKCLSEHIASNYLTNHLDEWDSIFIKKIRFKGKGYKIIKNKNVLYLVFNRSHITWFLFFNVRCIKFSKQKYTFLYKNYKYLNNILNNIYSIRPLNLFTKRGIRFTRQKVFKKVGKRTT